MAAGDAVALVLAPGPGYTPPAGDQVGLVLGGVSGGGGGGGGGGGEPPAPDLSASLYMLRRLSWGDLAALDRVVSTAWGAPGRRSQLVRQPWSALGILDRGATLPWKAPTSARRRVGLPWDGGRHRDRVAALPWSAVQGRSVVAGLPWSVVAWSAAGRGLPWGPITARDDARILPWSELSRSSIGFRADWSNLTAGSLGWVLPWGERPADTICERLYIAPAGDQVGLVLDPAGYAAPAGDAAPIVIPAAPFVCREIPPSGPVSRPVGWPPKVKGPPYEVPVRRLYYVLHSISLVRVDTGQPLPVESLRISTDADSWCWQLRATLRGRLAAGLVEPAGDGTPVRVEASINGTAWRFVVESWDEARRHAETTVEVTGRSLSALLSRDYTLPRDYTEASSLTAQQLALQELPAGWTLSWALTDWLVPAGAWSYQGLAPVGAMGRIAQSAGGILQSDRAGQGLQIRPRYPVKPWGFGNAIPDVVLPSDAARAQARAYTPPGSANAVYVHGESPGGVLGRVYISSTAGDVYLSTVVDPLITHVDAARQRGIRALAAAYEQPRVRQVSTWLGGDVPLIGIGDLIEYGSAAERGLVSSVSISASRQSGAVSVTQILGVGEQTGNPFRRLRSLSPGQPMLVGEITADHGDGTVSVLLVGGGTVRVRGSGTVGSDVYIRGGEVVSSAPGFTATDITV